jgi:CheY-like chemotaxis protein
MPSVLIVDDDTEVRKLLRESFEEAGFDVDMASDGAEGLAKYRARRADVVVTDILMPKRSGIELVSTLLREDRYVQIIAMSGVVGERFLEAGMEFGVKRVFAKPVNVDDLVTAARELVEDTSRGVR